MVKLSSEAQAKYDKIIADYGISDEAGLLILCTAMEAFDRMRGAQAIIEKEGITYRDRFKQVKLNPATTVERDARSAMIQALRQLHLDLEDAS